MQNYNVEQSDRAHHLMVALQQFSADKSSAIDDYKAADEQQTKTAANSTWGRKLLSMLQQQFGADSSKHVLAELRQLLLDVVDTSNATNIIEAVNQVLELIIPNIHTRDKFFTELRRQIRCNRTESEWAELQHW